MDKTDLPGKDQTSCMDKTDLFQIKKDIAECTVRQETGKMIPVISDTLRAGRQIVPGTAWKNMPCQDIRQRHLIL
jgi:hypothetical protein